TLTCPGSSKIRIGSIDQRRCGRKGNKVEIIKGDLSDIKGIPPSGLCVGVHRAGAIHQKMVAKYGEHLAVWSLRPDLDFVAFKKDGLGEQGIRSTSDMESIDASEKLI